MNMEDFRLFAAIRGGTARKDALASYPHAVRDDVIDELTGLSRPLPPHTVEGADPGVRPRLSQRWLEIWLADHPSGFTLVVGRWWIEFDSADEAVLFKLKQKPL